MLLRDGMGIILSTYAGLYAIASLRRLTLGSKSLQDCMLSCTLPMRPIIFLSSTNLGGQEFESRRARQSNQPDSASPSVGRLQPLNSRLTLRPNSILNVRSPC